MRADVDWTPMAVTAAWEDPVPVKYARLGGVIYLRGRVRGHLSGNSTIFILPPGFRPELVSLFHVDRTNVAKSARIIVWPDGRVEYGGSTTGSTEADYVSLNEVFFVAH